jgi:hypothetical protein
LTLSPSSIVASHLGATGDPGLRLESAFIHLVLESLLLSLSLKSCHLLVLLRSIIVKSIGSSGLGLFLST